MKINLLTKCMFAFIFECNECPHLKIQLSTHTQNQVTAQHFFFFDNTFHLDLPQYKRKNITSVSL